MTESRDVKKWKIWRMNQAGLGAASKADRPSEEGLGSIPTFSTNDCMNDLVVMSQKKVDGTTRTPRWKFTATHALKFDNRLIDGYPKQRVVGSNPTFREIGCSSVVEQQPCRKAPVVAPCCQLFRLREPERRTGGFRTDEENVSSRRFHLDTTTDKNFGS